MLALLEMRERYRAERNLNEANAEPNHGEYFNFQHYKRVIIRTIKIQKRLQT